MKNIKMSESAFIIVSDLTSVIRAQDALRSITQANSKDYISQKDYQVVMAILAKWLKGMYDRIETTDDKV